MEPRLPRFRGGQHRPLTCAKALYIGKAAPMASHDGLASMQKPLMEMYSKSDRKAVLDDHESTIYVFSSGILMRPVNALDKPLWLPMHQLESCAAVKALEDHHHGTIQFVPVDTPPGQSSPHPAILSIIMKRKKGGLNLSDCHAFICGSVRASMKLVDACSHAYANPTGWSDEEPTLEELGLVCPDVKIDNECYVDDMEEGCSKEYYDKPSLKGYFYAPRSDIIQKYCIGGEDPRGRVVCDCEPVEDFTTNCEQEQQISCPPGAQLMCVQPLQPCSQQQGGMLMYSAQGQQAGSMPQVIAPQQAQLYYPPGADSGQDYESYIKAQKKAQKKAWKKQQKAMEENVYMMQLPQGTGNEPIYASRLPVAVPNVYGGGSSRRGCY